MKSIGLNVSILIILWLSGCKDYIIVDPPPDVLIEFPLSVGSQWTYAIYDSISDAKDTVNVSIESQTIISSVQVNYLWRYEYRSKIETLYVARSNDTLRFSSTLEGYGQIINFIFPLQIGKRWAIPFTDSFFVATSETVTVPSGMYPESFRVNQMSLIPNDYSQYHYWIKPYIGIVKIYRGVFITVGTRITKETWQLLSHSFPFERLPAYNTLNKVKVPAK